MFISSIQGKRFPYQCQQQKETIGHRPDSTKLDKWSFNLSCLACLVIPSIISFTVALKYLMHEHFTEDCISQHH